MTSVLFKQGDKDLGMTWPKLQQGVNDFDDKDLGMTWPNLQHGVNDSECDLSDEEELTERSVTPSTIKSMKRSHFK